MLGMIVLFSFVILQFVVGFVVSRFVKSGEDYFVAGRRQGHWIITFSLFATWFGSESCLSTAGRAYEWGLSGTRSDPFGYTLVLLIYGIFLAVRLWGAKIVTVGDLIGSRFGPSAESITGVVLAVSSLLWASGQVRAFGHVLSAHSSLTLAVTIVIATGIAVAYTVLGGILADAYTDFIQGIILIAGLGILAVVAFMKVPDPLGVFSALTPQQTSFISPQSSFLENVNSWLVPTAGALACQEIVSRISCARSAGVARRSAFAATFLYLLVGLIPVSLGFLAPHLLGGVYEGNSEEILITLAQKHLPFGLNLLFAGALISSILSTVDSSLLSASALFTRNVLGFFRPLDDRQQLYWGRVFVVLGGIAACVMGIVSDSVYELVVIAESFGTSGVLILFLVALFSKKPRPFTGVITLAAGIASTILYDFVFEVSASYVWSLLTSLVVFIVSESVVGWRREEALVPLESKSDTSP